MLPVTKLRYVPPAPSMGVYAMTSTTATVQFSSITLPMGPTISVNLGQAWKWAQMAVGTISSAISATHSSPAKIRYHQESEKPMEIRVIKPLAL